jgi:hypothetical protein
MTCVSSIELEFDRASSLKEDNMKLSTMSLALCFALAPFAAHASDSAVQHHRALHRQHVVMPASATALVPAVKLDHDSDGLSRSRDECNRGCIDN